VTEREQSWSSADVPRQGTTGRASIIRMAGQMNRFGNFREVHEGRVADLLIHSGELLEDLSSLADPEPT